VTAVIFDCDGTLVDSEPLARIAWERALAPHGQTMSEADLAEVVGLPYPRVHAHFAARGPLPDVEAFWPALSRELFALIDDELEAFPDAVATLHDLRGRGVPVAVASSSPRERLERTLRRAGLADCFDASVAGDEVAHGKPAPDLFLAAARAVGALPQACVVVEDSAPGVEAGLAAGMAVLGVARENGGAAALAGAHRVTAALSAEAILDLASA
jgi:HAD superfamily hydrolase (TIGR01509 family)